MIVTFAPGSVACVPVSRVVSWPVSVTRSCAVPEVGPLRVRVVMARASSASTVNETGSPVVSLFWMTAYRFSESADRARAATMTVGLSWPGLL